MKPVRTKKIPTADGDDLRQSLSTIHDSIHTQAGLHAFDGTRRSLVEQGMRSRQMHDELASREPNYYNPCVHCSGERSKNLGGQFHDNQK